MRTNRLAFISLAAGVSFAAATTAGITAAHPTRGAASGLIVTTTVDTPSPCNASAVSLRCAIDQANADKSGDAITFAIPASDAGCKQETIQRRQVAVCTIALNAQQPGLDLTAGSTTIDGYTQAGAVANSGSIGSGIGDNAILTVQLAGSGAGATHPGLTISGVGDGLSGLAITGFRHGFAGVSVSGSGTTIAGNFIGVASNGKRGSNGAGVVVTAAQTTIGGQAAAAANVISANMAAGIALARRSSSATVQGNFVGTDPSGTRALGNGKDGLSIAHSKRNTIGGQPFAARNVFSANGSSGIAIVGSGGNVVQGNFIGTDVTGNLALGNGKDGSAGLRVETKGPHDGNNLIGGTVLGTINIISGNLADGIDLTGSSTSLTQGNVIEGNAIGSTPDGKTGLPNAGNGIWVIHDVNGASIGGTVQGTGNLIAFNGKSGVLVGGSPSEFGVHIAINQNIMLANGGLGIDLSPQGVVNCATSGPGPNDYVPCPVITVAKTTSASGTACSHCRVEVYFATGEPDDQGHGEAQELLGIVTASATGTWNAPFTLGKIRSGDLVTATATMPASSTTGAETSEYAANVPAGSSKRKSAPTRS